MNESDKHEVFETSGGQSVRMLVRGTIAVLLVVIVGAGYSYLTGETPPDTSPAVASNETGLGTASGANDAPNGTQKETPDDIEMAARSAANKVWKTPEWYSSAPIKTMTFADFLIATEEEQISVAALYLSDTLWKDYFTRSENHENLRRPSQRLVKETMLMVASDVAIEAELSGVFASIIAKPETAKALRPPR